MTKAIELASDIVTFWDNGLFEREDVEECAAELRRLAAVEQELAELKDAMGEPVAWAFVDFWKTQEEPADDCFFIHERTGTVPLYAKTKP